MRGSAVFPGGVVRHSATAEVPVVVSALLFFAGLALLVLGGDQLVKGATRIAERFGVAPVLIGLTVVAFGTSIPELAVSLSAALRGESQVAYGNVVGSNIANIGLIAGLAALIRPLQVEAGMVRREIPMMLGLSLLALLVGGLAGGIGRLEAAILLVAFAGLQYWTLTRVDRRATRDHTQRLGPAAARVAVALVCMVGGAELTVRGAIAIAEGWGVSKAVIGLTIVAVGTSLPELVATVVAVLRGHADIGLGNVVGSNFFNLGFILGTTGLVRPIPLPAGGLVDLLVMVGFAAVLLPMAFTGKRLVRGEGLVLLAAYAGFVAWRALGGQA